MKRGNRGKKIVIAPHITTKEEIRRESGAVEGKTSFPAPLTYKKEGVCKRDREDKNIPHSPAKRIR